MRRIWILGLLLTAIPSCSGDREEAASSRPAPRETRESLNVTVVPLNPRTKSPEKVVLFPREGGPSEPMV